jgi:hypothetical protein
VAPPQECLDGHHLAGLDRDLGLVVHGDLAVARHFQRAAQVGQEAEPLR